MEEQQLSDLFESARNETPVTHFSEMKSSFLEQVAAGSTGVSAAVVVKQSLWKKWLAYSFKLKVIIMTSAVSILTFSTLFITNQFNTTTSNDTQNVSEPQLEKSEMIEIVSEDGVQKTIVYNEKSEVVQVTIDSFADTKSIDQKLTLHTIEPEMLENNRVVTIDPTRIEPKTSTKVASDSLHIKKFLISEKTTNEEIERIQKQAIAAGIEFTFNTKVRNNKIKRLTMQMKKNGHRWSSKISGTDSFSFDFGWWEDANGKFVKFLCKDDVTMNCGDC